MSKPLVLAKPLIRQFAKMGCSCLDKAYGESFRVPDGVVCIVDQTKNSYQWVVEETGESFVLPEAVAVRSRRSHAVQN